ncbi:MAG: hypothetical protein C5B49_04570 [Bdellovibrio sp.]|nr:MAG: hypothetical protein C5B49_04570 [Bdellovibrio sp.]
MVDTGDTVDGGFWFFNYSLILPRAQFARRVKKVVPHNSSLGRPRGRRQSTHKFDTFRAIKRMFEKPITPLTASHFISTQALEFTFQIQFAGGSWTQGLRRIQWVV